MRIRYVAAVGMVLGAVGPAAPLLAAAGSGSGGFGGGGGGGGGGFGGGGGGYGGGGYGAPVIVSGDPTFLFIMFLLFVIVMIFSAYQQHRRRKALAGMRDPGVAARRDRKTARRRARRAEEVQRKSYVAAEDDPAFEADHVRSEAEALFREIQVAWDNRDRATLDRLVGRDLMVEWGRRLADFESRGWHNRVSIQGPVTIEYVGITNLPGTQDDRVVVRISALSEDYVMDGYGNIVRLDGMDSTTAAIREFWTLERRDDRWTLMSIEQELEGEHQLSDPIIAEPVENPAASDEALTDFAAQKAVDPATIAQLADLDFEGSALNAARDTSLIDRRFDPGVIEAAARRVLRAWAEAVDGRDDNLLAISDPQAVAQMLYMGDPSGRARLVVRVPHVMAFRVLAVEPQHAPPKVVLSADLVGIRFVEDRDTTDVLAGSRDRPGAFTQTWELGLTDSPDTPWRVMNAGRPGFA